MQNLNPSLSKMSNPSVATTSATASSLQFKIGDFAVCPGHGVGMICDIKSEANQFIEQTENSYFIIRLNSNGMKVMIPTKNKSGIRCLSNDDKINRVYVLLSDHDVPLDTSTWNRRYREYMEKIKTGDLEEIAQVFRSLLLLKDKKKSLSFGEKKMLKQCKELLVQEISLCEGNETKEVDEKLEKLFA